MHQTALDYLKSVKTRFPMYFSGRVVVEYGSMDINGSPRGLFEDCDYIGVDWRPGKGVDVVSRMHEFTPEWECGVVVSASTMEHDKHLYKSLDRCWEILCPRGLLLVTTVNEKWPMHSPEAGEDGYYRGVNADELKAWLLSKNPAEYEFKTESGHSDREIFLYAIKDDGGQCVST